MLKRLFWKRNNCENYIKGKGEAFKDSKHKAIAFALAWAYASRLFRKNCSINCVKNNFTFFTKLNVNVLYVLILSLTLDLELSL